MNASRSIPARLSAEASACVLFFIADRMKAEQSCVVLERGESHNLGLLICRNASIP
jgi:hypothetical protein